MKPSEDKKQKNLLCQFLAQNNIDLSNEILDKLYLFADLVVETKEFGNLISPKDSEKILSRHIADSLIPYIYMYRKINADADLRQHDESNLSSLVSRLEPVKWADMGAGAGCPVFPLAIALPKIQFFAVEPRHKRVEFMEFAKKKLHLDNLTVVGKRFETSGLAYLDVVSCRALSTFENDWERAQPGLVGGGIFVTLKSYNNIEHLEGNPDIHIYKYSLPEEEQVYALVTRGNK